MARPLERLEGKYEILEKIQEGGMGAIYTVRHRLLGEVRVVKVMRPHLRDEARLRDRFFQEARAAARLSHPGIARIFDFTVDEDENAYLVMEYIRGITLGELIRSGERPPTVLALEIAKQSLAALGHMHRQAIVHRDIAPDNLMLAVDDIGRPQVKLIDLGLAKMLEGGTAAGLTSSGIFLGKFRYASPEQFDETRGATEGSTRFAGDLYSFALVLYELLTGVYPIPGETATSLIAGHLFRPPIAFAESDPEGRVPEPLRRAILRGLAKDPGERHDSTTAFTAALFAEGGPTWPPQDLAPSDASSTIQRILELARNPPAASPDYRPGSTQVRLDDQFAPIPTPLPEPRAASESHLTLATPPVTPTTVDGAQATTRLPTSPGDKPIPSWAYNASIDPEKSTIVVPPPPATSEDDEVSRATEAIRRLHERQQDKPQHSETDTAPTADTLVTLAHSLAASEDFDTASAHLQAALELEPSHAAARELLPAVETCRRVALDERQEPRVTAETARAQARPTRLPTPPDDDSSELPTQHIATVDPRRLASDHLDPSEMATTKVPTQAVQPPAPLGGTEPAPSQTFSNTDATTLAAPLVSEKPTPSASSADTEDDGTTTAFPWTSLEATIEGLEMMVAQGQEHAALVQLQQAVRRYGEHPGLQALRSRLGVALLDRDAEVRQAEDPFGTVPSLSEALAAHSRAGTFRPDPTVASGSPSVTPAPPARGPQPSVPGAKPEPTVVLEGGAFPPPPQLQPSVPAGPPLATPPSAAHSPAASPTVAPPPPRQPTAFEPGLDRVQPRAAGSAFAELTLDGRQEPLPTGVDEGLGFGGSSEAPSVAAEAPAALPRRSDRPGTQVSLPLLLVGLLVVGALAAAGFWLMRNPGTGDANGITTEDVQPTTLSPGTVLLDVRPWAEIVRVVDAQGENPPLTGDQVTPRRLSLPPGTYTLTLSHPPTGSTQETQIEVQSGVMTELRIDLVEADADQFLQAMGW